MIHIKKVCDLRRVKKDNTYPIAFRITYKGKSRDISTGLSCRKEDWSVRKQSVRTKNKQLEVLEERLSEKYLNVLQKIKEFESSTTSIHYTVNDVLKFIKEEKKEAPTVHQFWSSEIKRLNQVQQYGNARNYSSALSGIQLKVKLNISFEEINYKWLVNLETKFREAGLKQNTISTYFRKLKAIYNKAINYGIVDANSYPFRNYKITSESTPPKVISIEELHQFFSYYSANTKHMDACNYGKLIFTLRGTNLFDLALLTSDNIKEDRIIYSRSKTHKLYSIKILPLVDELIQYYHDPKRLTLFPILNNNEYLNTSVHQKRIGQQRKNINKRLTLIGKELRFSENLTTYYFRYSWANACKKMGYSKDMIGEGLGHSTGSRVTTGYLEDYDLELIDEMNATVCNKVIRGA